MKKLSLMDYAFLALETPESPKHVAALQIFEPPEDYPGDFIRELMQTLLSSEVGPPFNYLLRPALLGRPRWEELPALDLKDHVHHVALPAPGTLDSLMQLVARLHTPLLDRGRPLWECWLIEGLRNRRFALYMKMHHVFIDGASGMLRLQRVYSSSPKSKGFRSFWAPLQHPAGNEEDALHEPKQGLLQTAAHMIDLARSLPKTGRTMLAKGLGMLNAGQQPVPLPFTAPRTLLNAPASTTRRVAGTSFSLRRVKALGQAADVTVNDVLLAVIDGALNRYLRKLDALPDKPLVAEIPLNIRPPGDAGIGNEIGMLLVRLGSPDASPLTRLREIRVSSNAAKEEARNLSKPAIMAATLLPQGIAELAERVNFQPFPPLGSFVFSNPPNINKPLYLNGARMVSLYPVSALPPGLALNISVVTHGDAMDFGLIANGKALPDLNELTAALQACFRELEMVLLVHKNREPLLNPDRRGDLSQPLPHPPYRPPAPSPLDEVNRNGVKH